MVNKTIAQYLKTQVDTNTLNWELYLAPMAFAYNTSFHRTISSTPFKVTYGLDARTPDFEPKQLYGEDLPTELYQRMQACHNMAKKLAMESTDKAIDTYTKNHNKSLNPRTFKEGDKVLLKVKDFKLKNRKLCEEWKGPFIITKVFPNNTALIKTKFGKHEVMYNFNMLKHYHEEEVKKMAKSPEEAEKDLNPEPPKRTYSKRIIENRPDGGPVTRSRSMQQQQQANGAKIPYAAVVKNSPAKNLADQVNARQNDKINYAKMQAKCIKDTDLLKTNTDQHAICEIKKRLQKAKRTLENIQKLNSDQWASLKKSVEKETKVWKKCMIKRNLEPQHLGPTFECDQYGLPRLTPGIKQPVWVHNRRKFLQSLTFHERNIVLTGDPFVEFDPYTYILVYNYPEQVQNYPNIAQNFQHIVQNQIGGPPKTAPQSPASSSSSVLSSPEKVVKELRSRTITTEIPYAKPKSKSWLKTQMAKVKSSQNLRMGKPRKPPKPP